MPLDISPSLAGNFGELRPNHFHMGLDFKTDGKENLPVYAVADGELSRVLISSNGYGLALYINHPELGLTSVYAHLNSFIPEIQNYTDQIQYALKVNTLDTLFITAPIKIKRGQIIAYSGNTGGSEGAHLHFEIRNMTTERTINPLKYFPTISDNIPPLLSKIVLYDTDVEFPAMVSEHSKASLQNKTIETNRTNIGFGVASFDQMNGTSSRFGIYKIILYEEDVLKYKIQFDSLDFNYQSYVNLVGDQFKRPDDVYRIFETTCSQDIFRNQQNGIISLEEGIAKNIRIEVYDFKGNKSFVQFVLKGSSIHANKQVTDESTHLNCKTENEIKTKNIDILFAENTFPSSMKAHFKSLAPTKGELSRFLLFNYKLPVFNKYQIRFNHLSNPSSHTLYLKCLNPKSTKTWIGHWEQQQYIVEGIKTFGEFALKNDKSQPSIELLKLNQHATYIYFRIKDEESGIKRYQLYEDDVWQKVYFDEKTDMLKFKIPKRDNKLRHNLLLNVEDKVGNINSKRIELFY